MSPWGLYVHVPWCRVRCPYCAFHVDVDHDTDWNAFVDRLLAEHREMAPSFEGPPATVYLGGGTPSRMPLPALERVLGALAHADLEELTLEANPEDIDRDWLDAVIDLGVDRISLGVQSVQERHARRLGRAHSASQALDALSLLASSPLRSWSADLMFGLHDQTLAELDADLDAMLAFAPPHISLYGLTIEPDTAYARAAAAGKLDLPDEDLWRQMMEHLLGRLHAEGIHRYEVSNFARQGHQARHNRGYWQSRPYLGLGPSATGRLPDGRVRINVSDTLAWQRGAPPLIESPTADEAATDMIVAQLRSVEGLDLDALWQQHGRRIDEAVLPLLQHGGGITTTASTIRLTEEGFYIADAITRAVVLGLTE